MKAVRVAGEDEVGRLPGVVLEVVPPELGDEAEVRVVHTADRREPRPVGHHRSSLGGREEQEDGERVVQARVEAKAVPT